MTMRRRKKTWYLRSCNRFAHVDLSSLVLLFLSVVDIFFYDFSVMGTRSILDWHMILQQPREWMGMEGVTAAYQIAMNREYAAVTALEMTCCRDIVYILL
jgi:hypothetical protein